MLVRFVAYLGRLNRSVIVRVGGRFAFRPLGVRRFICRMLLLDGFANDQHRITSLLGGAVMLVMMRGGLGFVAMCLVAGHLIRRFSLGGVATVLADRRAAHAVAAARGAALAAAPGAAVDLVVGLALRALLFGDQRLPVGDRNLVVLGMDFAEGEKAVAVAAVFDEGCLQRRFDPCYLGEIDVAA